MADIFNTDNTIKFWKDQRQRVADAVPEGTIDFSDMEFPEDPAGEYFHNITFHSDADFSGATFLHSTVFSKAVFEQDAIFENCKFPDGGIFLFTQFHGDAEFGNTFFDGKTRFAGVVFMQDANFSGSTFNAMAAFESEESPSVGEHKKTEFQYFANFDRCIWKEYVHFLDVIFRDDAFFKNGTFEYELDFDKCEIKGRTNFEAANFLEYSGKKDKRRNRVRFLHNSFHGKVSFWNVRFDCPVRYVDNHFDDHAEFRKAEFNNSVLIDRNNHFNDRLFLDTDFKSFSRPGDSIEPYRVAKQTAHQAGDSEMEGIYHFQHKCAESVNNQKNATLNPFNVKFRKLKSNLLFQWLGVVIGRWFFGYGERPLRPLITGCAVILIWAILFLTIGGIDKSGNTGTESTSIGTCLYFSTVTFTTLGYGDIKPTPGFSRLLSSTEAVLGAAIMAVFIVSLTRKFIR
ncbi:MAG: potassium channel family protein [Planctomycetes bacterium]|nr:potassium channel family protein [Planctomycetota bacterium]